MIFNIVFHLNDFLSKRFYSIINHDELNEVILWQKQKKNKQQLQKRINYKNPTETWWGGKAVVWILFFWNGRINPSRLYLINN